MRSTNSKQSTALIDQFRSQSKSVKELDRAVTEQDIWAGHEAIIWKAPAFDGSPEFYPVYRYKDHYSFSPLALLMLKRELELDPHVRRATKSSGFRYTSSRCTLDKNIVRIGQPMISDSTTASEQEYLELLTQAMLSDVRDIEERNPDHVNVVMVGGKDSLNLLLLPWVNPVIAVSGQPNYPLVRTFIAENGLDIDTVELDDSDTSLIDAEILVNFCRNDLRHCRWSPHLRRINKELSRKAIFWKGQVGNGYMTPYWSNVTHPRWVGSAIKRCPEMLNNLWRNSEIAQRYFLWTAWHRGAMWQGAHMGIIRELTDALVVSAYNGPEFKRLISSLDFTRAVRRDIRADVGERLAGAPVRYPDSNPSPPLSSIRQDISHLEPFLATAGTYGII